MAELKTVAGGLGLADVRTYLASGNLLFGSDASPRTLEPMLEQAIERHFGFAVDVIVRSRGQWAAIADANPFPEESRSTPNLVMLVLGKEPAGEAAVAALRARAGGNEKVEQVGEALWIHFGDGAGRSKIGSGPARGIWTARNWRTVEALRELAG